MSTVDHRLHRRLPRRTAGRGQALRPPRHPAHADRREECEDQPALPRLPQGRLRDLPRGRVRHRPGGGPRRRQGLFWVSVRFRRLIGFNLWLYVEGIRVIYGNYKTFVILDRC